MGSTAPLDDDPSSVVTPVEPSSLEPSPPVLDVSSPAVVLLPVSDSASPLSPTVIVDETVDAVVGVDVKPVESFETVQAVTTSTHANRSRLQSIVVPHAERTPSVRPRARASATCPHRAAAPPRDAIAPAGNPRAASLDDPRPTARW